MKEQCLDRNGLFSEDSISTIRTTLKETLGESKDICVVTVGSLARREASAQSDIDFFVIYKIDEEAAKSRYTEIIQSLSSTGLKMPSKAGAFNKLVSYESLLDNIGGNGDSTETLTRRMLLLLECEWLYNKQLFDDLFDDAINRYVRESITQHQLCRFLLNDLIRYYRTICVDFEFKTSEEGKTWGDRNIKLLFSRKLLYFSGLLVVAETAQHTCEAKREILKKYLRMTPIERIQTICGKSAEKALQSYDSFLERISDESVRKMLNETPLDRDKQSEEFRKFKNDGHHFSWKLSKLFRETYDSSHPINHAIIF